MSATKTAYQAFVGGKWVDSASGETMEVIAPATGEVIAEVPRCGAEDVDRAVEAAKKVLPACSTRRRRSAPSSCTSSRT
jgi:acyl-CoA reductase-like NAD-dependent aldehyde dehydrogenase